MSRLSGQVRFEPEVKPVEKTELERSWEKSDLTLSERVYNYIVKNPSLNPSYRIVSSFDSLSNKLIVRENFGSHQSAIPLVLSPDNYASELYRTVLRSSFREVMNREERREEERDQRNNQGVGFTVPIPMGSQAFSRLFGSAGVGLRVNGNIAMTGNLIHQEQSQVKTAINQASEYTFKLEQKQRFNVTGKIGDKVDVLIDQDSERDFDFENNIRIYYTGEEDEIVKKVEAGNIALALPGTRFVTFSGSNSGLFGLKTDLQVGNLDLTAIASIEKGQKKKLSVQGGSEAQVTALKDYNYVTGMYFFVDTQFRNHYGVNEDGLINAMDFVDRIADFELWRGGRNYQLRPDAREAWAVTDPKVYLQSGSMPVQEDQNTRHQYFQRLEPNKDYYINKQVGYVVLAQKLNNEILACAYRTPNAGNVGHISPPDSSQAMVLKLLRNDRPLPSDHSWKLEWRNVYQLGGRGLTKDGLEIAIIDNRSSTRSQINQQGKNYLEVFKLDLKSETGGDSPDDKADFDNVNIFNLPRGELIFPDLEPFDKHLYDTTFVNPADYNKYSNYDIEVKSKSAASSYNLGFNVLEGSEEVTLDGRRLTRGADYEIDYAFGSLRIVNEDALRPGANLDIRYESGQVFQLDKKSLFGLRGQYNLWENSFIGFTGLFNNERILEQRVRVGQEPVSNMVWDVNSKFTFEPEFITSVLDKLPRFDSNAPSAVDFEAEVGQILPNPNSLNSESTGDNNGVAYLDDFESSTRITTIPIARRGWTRASVPYFTSAPPDVTDFNRHGRLTWFNPWQQVLLTDIFPDKEINTRSGTHQNVMTLQRRPNPNHLTGEPWWAGIMTALSSSYYNQSESKFIEAWVQGTKGVVHIDLGLISEDAIPNGALDTEDQVGGIPNGILDPGEDIGLDGIPAVDSPGSGEPYDDDWVYGDRSDNYEKVNGTEGNGSGAKVDGARIPDTEDINQNGSLDTRNDYFEYSFDISFGSSTYNKYVVGGLTNEKNWRLYRIPLKDFSKKIGNPEFTRIEFMRIWVENLEDEEQITFAQINFVGNDWKELGVSAKLDSFDYKPRPDALTVAVMNTEENAGVYVQPPGVTGIEDRVTGVTLREQSMVLRYSRIQPGEAAAIQKTYFENQDIIHYKQLKMFVHGDLFPGSITVNEDSTSNMMFYFRFGRDENNYFEVREYIYPDWDDLNEVDIPIRSLSTILFDTTGGYPEWGGGKYYAYKGNPTIRQIQVMTMGVINVGDFPASGEVWFDELRVTNVEKKPGTAMRVRTDLRLADLGNLTLETEKKDAEFRTVSEHFGTGDNSLSGSLSGSLNLGKFLSKEQVYSVPFSFAVSRMNSIPKYLTGRDILAEKGAVPDSIYEREIKQNNSSRFNISYSKSRKSDNWLLANTVDNLSFNFGQNSAYSQDYNTEYNRNTSRSIGLNYILSLKQKTVTPFDFLGKKIPILNKLSESAFNFVPSNFSYNAGYSGSQTTSLIRGSTEKETQTASLSRSLNAGYDPFQSMKFSFSRQYNNDLRLLKKKTAVFSGNFGDELSMTQNFSGDYSPKLLSFLTHSFGYQSTYNHATNIQLRSAGISAQAGVTKTARFSFSPEEIIKGGGADSRAGRRRPAPRRGRDTNQGAENQETPQDEGKANEETDGRPFILFRGMDFFLNRIAPINFSLTQQQGVNAVGLEKNPTKSFMFGFDEDHGAPVKSNIGTQQGSSTNRNSMSLSSGLNIVQSIRTTVKYDKDEGEQFQGITRTGTSSESYFIKGDTKIPFFDWSVNISGFEKLWPFNRYFSTISLTHAYSGKKAVSLQTERNEETDQDEFTPVNSNYTSGFSPLIGLNLNWKKNVSTSVNYGNSESLIDDVKSRSMSKNLQKTLTISSRYSKSGGLRIPLPFLSNKELKNTVDFQLSYSMRDNVSLRTNPKGEFITSSAQSNWSLKPEVRYSFSTRITGGFQFELGQQKNLLSGDQKIRDFGVNINIQISG